MFLICLYDVIARKFNGVNSRLKYYYRLKEIVTMTFCHKNYILLFSFELFALEIIKFIIKSISCSIMLVDVTYFEPKNQELKKEKERRNEKRGRRG